MPTRLFALSLLALASPAVYALDAKCQAVLDASEARIRQPAWHSTMEFAGGIRMEAIKANGQFFRRTDGKWAKFSIDLDAAEGKLLGQIRNGEVKLTQCNVVGSDMVDGTAVTVVASTTEMPGVPPAESRLYIGQQDGLPYRQTGKSVTVIYRYKDVAEPKL
jgi:hypothetical protein